MDYTTHIKRTLSSFFQFLAVAMWFLYLYFKLWDFAKAAIMLRYINVQTVSFILYSFILILLPASIIYTPRHSKDKLFRFIGFSMAVVLVVGAVGDLITYNFFSGYTFREGDAVFCNIVVSVPNLCGTFCCFILAAAYALFGVYMTKNRLLAYLLYLTIFLIGLISPFMYAYVSWGGFPRQTWVEKSAFIIPHQLCMFLSFTMLVGSDLLWREHIR